MNFDRNPENRAANVKKGLSEAESRRKREDGLLDLRRLKRQEVITKRRQRDFSDIGSDDSEITDLDISRIPSIVSCIMQGGDRETIYNNTLNLRKIISKKQNPPIDRVIQSGVLPRLVSFIDRTDDEKLVFEASWILTNVASGTTEHTRHLISLGAVPKLVALLRSPNLDIAEQSCWALGNISGDHADLRDEVLRHGAMDPLLNFYVRTKRVSVVRTATWTLSNFCRGKPEPPFAQMQKCLPFLANLIGVDDKQVLVDAAWSLSFICDENTKDNAKIDAVLKTGVLKRVVWLLRESETQETLKMPLLRIVGNIVTGDDAQTQQVIDNNGLLALESIFAGKNRNLRKEAVWTMSNISAGNPSQVAEVVKSGLVKNVADCFAGESFEVKKEFAWVISNIIASSNVNHINYIVDVGGIRILCDLLTCNDERTVLVALEGLGNFLEVGERMSVKENGPNRMADHVEEIGGLDKLEQTQEKASEKVYKKTVELITKFFSEDQELGGLQPRESEDKFSFGDFSAPGNGEFKF